MENDQTSTGTRRVAALLGSEKDIAYVYKHGRRERLARLTNLLPGTFDAAAIDRRPGELREIEVAFSTWGIPPLTRERLDAMPNLKALFYAAGTVQAFAPPLLDRGIAVVSAWQANAVPVAEFTLAQILLAAKGYFQNADAYRSADDFRSAPRGLGIFDQTIAILGAGAIGRKVIELLRPFRLDVIVFDPFLDDGDARSLGVRTVSLERAFAEAAVVSNHIANLPATVGILRGHHFASMPPLATFINTGRGAQVNEPELIEILHARPDLYVLLDVTWPEPPAADSPLWTLPNVKRSTHIAGALGNEVVRMADWMIEEFERWNRGEPLRYQVTREMLERMA